MSRALITSLLALALMIGSIPALAHTVSYTTRESGTLECDFDENVRTDVKAYGHHKHTKVGTGSVFFHTPTTSQEFTYVVWNAFAMTWATGNQSGYSYNWTSSGGKCTV